VAQTVTIPRVDLLKLVIALSGAVALLVLGPHAEPGELRGDASRAAAPAPARAASERFVTLPPGSVLPEGDACSKRIDRHGREARPGNTPRNRTRGRRLVIPPGEWRHFPAWRSLATRVDGDFTGTTDEIVQWASCKWGFDDDLTRAQAQVESSWDQDHVGDEGQSVGLMQVKAAHAGTPHRYTWPHSRASTAYNLDYALAWRRACYEGHFAEGGWLPAGSRGDLWGCTGLWYSGSWHRGDEEYLASVRHALAARSWPKAAGGNAGRA